jgi:hypothetical protein
VLFPSESLKVQTSMSQSQTQSYVDQSGRVYAPVGSDTRQSLSLAAGLGLSPRGFIAIQQPFQQNSADEGRVVSSGLGDPSMYGRYSLVLPDLTSSHIPQVQIIGAYKANTGKSRYDNVERRYQSDVFGTGHQEIKTGVDVFFSRLPWLWGGAISYAYQIPRRDDDNIWQRPGGKLNMLLSGGAKPLHTTKIVGGLSREQKDSAEFSGFGKPTSVSHSFFTTLDQEFLTAYTVRVGYALTVKIFDSRGFEEMNTWSAAINYVF